MKWLMHIAQEKGLIKVHPFTGFGCKPGYKRRSFLSEEELQRLIHVELRYKRQQAMRDMLLSPCMTKLFPEKLHKGVGIFFKTDIAAIDFLGCDKTVMIAYVLVMLGNLGFGIIKFLV